MSRFTVAASTSAASLGARAAAAAKRRPGSLRAKGSGGTGGSMTRGVSLRVRAMNADEAPKKMNPEQSKFWKLQSNAVLLVQKICWAIGTAAGLLWNKILKRLLIYFPRHLPTALRTEHLTFHSVTRMERVSIAIQTKPMS